jgi:YVTN family beta-propeller protein
MATRPVSVYVMPRAAQPLATQGSALAFLLLGPLEVWVEGRALELRRRKQRLLLTLLLLRPGEVVSRDRLVEELWGEDRPKAALGSLQNVVSELRKVLVSEIVCTRAAGYSLEVERECIDVHRFERLVGEAREHVTAERRMERLLEALALWRGPPLAEFAFEPFAQVEVARLEELRTAAREKLVEAKLELGYHGELVGELEALVAEYPLRERLRAQLMLALYRSGRQTEALAAYQDARRMLTEELGLEPSDELQQLERAILVHDPLLQPGGSITLPVDSGMEFRVLGPLEVSVGGQPLPLGKTKQRALLAFMLLHANRVVSRDQLINALWGEKPPETAATALHGYVSGLRKSIGPNRIETRSPGYLLHIAPGELDLVNFERMLVQARALAPATAAERLEEALTLWRGIPLADLNTVPFVALERPRLEELQLGAIEERIEADLALGRHAGLIAELQALVRAHPLRERLRRQLMLALYRSGRQAEALEVYQHGRHLLAEDLGLEPGEELKSLELAILKQDPALQQTAPTAGARREVASRSSTDRSRMRGRRLYGRPYLAAVVGVLVLTAALAGITVALTRGSEGGVSVIPNSVAIVDSETNRLVGDVAVGRRPVAVAFGEGAVWVANADDGTVSRIDPRTRKVTNVIPLGTDIQDLATGFRSVWVANGKDGTLARIDSKLGKVKTLRLAGGNAVSLPPVRWVATGAGRVWATSGNTLLEIDPTENDVVAKTDIPPPAGLAAGLGAAWLVTQDQRLLQVVPGTKAHSKAIEKVTLTHDALAPTVGAGSVWLIVYNGTGEIWRVDPRSGAVNIIPRAGRYPLDLAVADGSEYVWAVDLTGAVARINPNIGLTVARIRTAPTIRSALAVGAGVVWVAVQD